jgi:hypothetical protein
LNPRKTNNDTKPRNKASKSKIKGPKLIQIPVFHKFLIEKIAAPFNRKPQLSLQLSKILTWMLNCLKHLLKKLLKNKLTLNTDLTLSDLNSSGSSLAGCRNVDPGGNSES